MITIYHNPRCTKSRQGLALLEEKQLNFEVIRYLDDPITLKELKAIVEKLGITPLALVRKNEAIWKSNFKGKDLSDEDILKAMVSNPKLIERPIVINGEKAVIGRPTEQILTIL
ncbi:arsenate reductase (glutaredoxin) [Winogradskyella aurantiaca]|uniref:arsenate reductase (glutaredoxin) n=1 Tax=Winogradskyella aurantiaca TaxID=2219558 RepID=UPI000E1CBD6E|nr:arsenate reductase (glutaredoxin) [Winogradskyella aurantiaca]